MRPSRGLSRRTIQDRAMAEPQKGKLKEKGGRFTVTIRLANLWRRKWVRVAILVAGIPAIALSFVAGYYYVSFARDIDARLQGARQRVVPRVFARPLELRRGQALTDRQLVDRLNDLGYAQRPAPSRAGEFAVGDGFVTINPRAKELQ